MTAEKTIQQASNRSFDEADTAHRMLPHNLEAEQGLLGGLLVDKTALDKVGDILLPEHFYAPAHQRIYEAILKITDRGQIATPVTLKNYFENDEDLQEVGGSDYLVDLAAATVTIVNSEDYARTIYDLHLRRQLFILCETTKGAALNICPDQDAIGIMEQHEQKLFSLTESGLQAGTSSPFRDSLTSAIKIAESAFQHSGHITGVPTGLRDLDELLGGFHPSDLLILAGRPSMGKTALATNIAFNAAKKYLETGGREGAITGFFSLEMSSDQLATRILSDVTNISGDAIRKGQIKKEDFRRFEEARKKFGELPLYTDDSAGLSIAALRTRARRMKAKENIGFLIVDYLQLLQEGKAENRTQEVTKITSGLKAIAKDLNIPVLALSQLSRDVEKRENKRPLLSDLRESGSIEQDSDIVMFIYREEYYLSREEPSQYANEKPDKFTERYEDWERRKAKAANVAEVNVAKQRHGPIGTIDLHFNPDLTRFSDYSSVNR